MKTIGYIVLKGGQPCGLVNVAGGVKGGVLMPATMEEHVTMFLKPRDARRVVTRTGKVAATLRDSLIRDWPRAQPLFEDQPFTVLPVSKQ